MNTTLETTINNESDLAIAENEETQAQSDPKRGRPRVPVVWPQEEFTFNSILSENVLSASSLRKKMRAELLQGGLVKVNTLKTAFGRPQNIYKKVQEQCQE